MRSIKRIIRIHKIEGYKVYCLFNNGESRIIDFQRLFEQWKISEKDREYLLMKSESEFQKIEVIDGTFVWKNMEIKSTDEEGNEMTGYYDLDPIVLYQSSEPDESRQLEIGLMIRQARKELGFTQEELARKSGTTKHYISRIENNASGIELATLKKIVEGGLGRRLQILIR
ncbi:MAG: helix-turn-helix transcriptional regulator [Bacteroidia bacterium]|nr:helix-turn-helix transcriptional regulator [Bacteroidia bacterium]